MKAVAESYINLFNTEYLFVLGRSNKIKTLRIAFSRLELPHLLGVHYLEDIYDINKSARKIIKDILNNKLSNIQGSNNYNKIVSRLEALSILKEIIEDENSVFKLIKHNWKFNSNIKADFLIEYKKENKVFYLFLKKQKYLFYPITCFLKTGFDYAENQPKWTILMKKKIYDGQTDTLYVREGYISK